MQENVDEGRDVVHLGGDQDSEHPSPNPDATTGSTASQQQEQQPQVEKAREALEQMSVENGGAGKS